MKNYIEEREKIIFEYETIVHISNFFFRVLLSICVEIQHMRVI